MMRSLRFRKHIQAEEEVSEIDAHIETFFGDAGDDEVLDVEEDSAAETVFDQAPAEESADDLAEAFGIL